MTTNGDPPSMFRHPIRWAKWWTPRDDKERVMFRQMYRAAFGVVLGALITVVGSAGVGALGGLPFGNARLGAVVGGVFGAGWVSGAIYATNHWWIDRQKEGGA